MEGRREQHWHVNADERCVPFNSKKWSPRITLQHRSLVLACWVERAARPPRVRIVRLVCPYIRRLPILPPRDLWAVNHPAPNQRRACLRPEIKTRRVTKHHRGLVEASDRLPCGKARVREERASLCVNRPFHHKCSALVPSLSWQVVTCTRKLRKVR